MPPGTLFACDNRVNTLADQELELELELDHH